MLSQVSKDIANSESMSTNKSFQQTIITKFGFFSPSFDSPYEVSNDSGASNARHQPKIISLGGRSPDWLSIAGEITSPPQEFFFFKKKKGFRVFG